MSNNPRAHVRFKKKYLKKSMDSRDWVMERQGNSHLRLTFIPTGEYVTAAGTPSDRNSIKHVWRAVERIEKAFAAKCAEMESPEEFSHAGPTIQVGDRIYLPADRPQIMEVTHDITAQEVETQPEIKETEETEEDDVSSNILYNPGRRTRATVPCANGHKHWLDDELIWLAENVETLTDVVTEDQMISWCKYLQRSPGAIREQVRVMGMNQNLITAKQASLVPIWEHKKNEAIARKAGLMDAQGRRYKLPAPKSRLPNPDKPRVYGVEALPMHAPVVGATYGAQDYDQPPETVSERFKRLLKEFNQALLDLESDGATVDVSVTGRGTGASPQIKVTRRLVEEF